MRRTSSRFCLGVEHGDYNGTDLFGVGADRFIWIAYKANGLEKVRIYSANFPKDGVGEFRPGEVPPPCSAEIADKWLRFAYGTDFILRREGFPLKTGFDAVVYGNIPGGGMSRSASLTINLALTFLEINGIESPDTMAVAEMARAVENDYVGSPCGMLDQVMILYAKKNMGVYFSPGDKSVKYIPFGGNGAGFRFLSLDTGTVRSGLEKSTYAVRRAECEKLAEMAGPEFGIAVLGEVRDDALFGRIMQRFGEEYANLCERLDYIYNARKRFDRMIEAWKAGDIETVGSVFRTDGIGLRDKYRISGPELETMCDIVRGIEGCLGERMLGGGDKGAAGAIVRTDSVRRVKDAVDTGYPRSHPELAGRYGVHVCDTVDGVKVFNQSGRS